MGKLDTKLINDTRKTLVLYEEASNTAQTRICELRRPNEQPAAVLETNTDTKRTNIAGEPSFYVRSVDPNDSYSTLRVWFGSNAVLGVTTDEMVDNDVITIRQEGDAFIKHCKPRNEAAPEGDAPKKQKEQTTLECEAPKEEKEQTTTSPFGNFFKRMGNFFKPR
ncbi:unnamed protein product [Sphagnum balticum]